MMSNFFKHLQCTFAKSSHKSHKINFSYLQGITAPSSITLLAFNVLRDTKSHQSCDKRGFNWHMHSFRTESMLVQGSLGGRECNSHKSDGGGGVLVVLFRVKNLVLVALWVFNFKSSTDSYIAIAAPGINKVEIYDSEVSKTFKSRT